MASSISRRVSASALALAAIAAVGLSGSTEAWGATSTWNAHHRPTATNATSTWNAQHGTGTVDLATSTWNSKTSAWE